MKTIIAGIFFYIVIALNAESQNCSIIPYPQNINIFDGEFAIKPETRIIAPASLNSTAEILSEEIKNISGFKTVVISKGNTSGNIVLLIDKTVSNPEGYRLNVSSDSIRLTASTAAGIFYGIQTIKQLLISSENGVLNAMTITDSPRFAWRGVMLDVSRTFMPLNLVKRYIDLFSQYKLNVVHLHLTDDQGWRIEIKRYPLLTEIGSKFDPEFNRMGGYYSQDEIRDLVKYAQKRNVMLVPEIELPGHACAALASYPSLSCNEIRPVIHTFLEGKSIHEEIFCAGKETTYEFISGIIDELCGLFPSPYIHIGGDEAPKARWQKCPDCQKMIKDNNLKNEEELQSLFVRRIGDYLRTKNKTLVGWDEIIDGGKLAGNEVLMFWRGWKLSEVEKEVKAGFRVVCTPTTHCYFDYPYKSISTKTIFDYDPVIPGTSDKNYLGVQANFWSHIDRSEHNIDKQLFPRILGLAETGWCKPENKDWDKFKTAAVLNIGNLIRQNVNVFNDSTLNR